MTSTHICPDCGLRFAARDFSSCPGCLFRSALPGHGDETLSQLKISHYRIVKELGRGGMGEVFLARDTRLDRWVALKLISQQLESRPEARARFLNEARAAAALDHPFICHIHEAGEFQGIPFIVMEYVEGQTLQEKLEEGPVEIQEALRIGVEILEALQPAHDKGILHRDLKPSNVILTLQGHAKVTDFGLAKLPLSEGDAPTALTEEDSLLGTLAYMSPEQLRGQRPDHRSDIYSVGVILLEIITGLHPFQGPTRFETAAAILAGKSGSGLAEVSRRSSDLGAILEQMLTPDRERRPGSAAQLADRLENLRGQIIQAPVAQPPPTVRAAPDWRLPTLLVTLGALLVLLLVYFRPWSPQADYLSLAVLALEDLSEPPKEHIAEGITDSLIGKLSQIEALSKVSARRSVMRYKDTEKTLRTIGSELGVRYLVEGMVLIFDRNIEVRARLYDATTEDLIWQESYKRQLQNVLQLQDQIAREIAREVRVQLTPEEENRLTGAAPVDLGVYNDYTRGLAKLQSRTVSDLGKALKFFQSAIDQDDHFAPAWAGMARTYLLSGDMQYRRQSPRLTLPLAQEAAKKALDLDKNLPDAHLALAQASEYLCQHSKAEAAFRRALELDDKHATALLWYGHLLATHLRFGEANRMVDEAVELDPASPLALSTRARILYYQGRFQQSLREYRRALDLEKDFFPAHLGLALAYLEKGRLEEAEQSFRTAFFDQPAILEFIASLFSRTSNREALQMLLSDPGQSGFPGLQLPPIHLAVVCAAFGFPDLALKRLEEAYRESCGNLLYLKVDPVFDQLRSDPRYHQLLEQVGMD